MSGYKINIMTQNGQKTMKTKYKKDILNRYQHTTPKREPLHKETNAKCKQRLNHVQSI
jgi:hypothetical protein